MGRGVLSSQRWQWVGLGAASVVAVLRVVFNSFLWPTVALLGVSLVFGLFFIVIAAPRARHEMAEGWELRDAWKPLSRSDRRAVRRAVRERLVLPALLLGPGEVYARTRARNGERLPWSCIGFAMISTSSSWYPWTLIVVALALVLGVVVVVRGPRWRGDHLAMLGQQHAVAP